MSSPAMAAELEQEAAPVIEGEPAEVGTSDGNDFDSVPITKADVRGEDPKAVEDAPAPAPDRELVAPKLVEFLAEQAKPDEPEMSPLEARLARIEAALIAPAEETPIPVADQTLAKIEALEARLAEQADKAAREAEETAAEAVERTLREGVAANLKAQADKYPGLIKLGWHEKVYPTLKAQLQAHKPGEPIKSEDDIASEAEKDLRTHYELLHSVYGGETTTTSEDPVSSEDEETPTPTLTQSLTGAEEAATLDELVEKHGVHAAADIMWRRTVGN